MNWKKAWASKKVRKRGEWLESRVIELEGLVGALTKLKDEREAECRLRAKLILALRDVNAHLDAKQYEGTNAEREAAEGATIHMETCGMCAWPATLRGLLERMS